MSSREESYSGYPLWIVPLTGGPAPTPDTHPNAVRIYADENQDLRTLKSDGTDAPIEGGGGSQAVDIVGPYPIAYTDSGIDADGVLLGPFLTAGQVVLDMWLIVGTPWAASSGSIGASLGISRTDAISVWQIASAASVASAADGDSGFTLAPTTLTASRQALVDTSNVAKLAMFILDSDTLTAGTADIYALIYTPA